MKQQWQNTLYDIYQTAFWAGVDATLRLPVQELDQAQAWHNAGGGDEPPLTLAKAAMHSQTEAMMNTLQVLRHNPDAPRSSLDDSGYRLSEINWQAIRLYNAPPDGLGSARQSQWRAASHNAAHASWGALLILRPDGSRDGARFSGTDVLGHVAELVQAVTPHVADDCRAIGDHVQAKKYGNLLSDVKKALRDLQHLQNAGHN